MSLAELPFSEMAMNIFGNIKQDKKNMIIENG